MIIEENESTEFNQANIYGLHDNLNESKVIPENLYEFNPGSYTPDPMAVSYPSMHSVLGNSRYSFNNKDNEITDDFKFDDISHQNYNYDFNKEDFNFK